MSSKPPSDSRGSDSPKPSNPEAANSAPLPFERTNSRKKQPKKPASLPTSKAAPQEHKPKPATTAEMAVPDVVSKRMASRMALFCGIPTSLGMATFVVSYVVVSHNWLKLPNVAVVLLSMGFFGLGVLGLTYGVLSASWDEEVPGSKLGWGEFTTNWGRMTSAWRSARQKE